MKLDTNQAEVAELRKDAERLDWMDRQTHFMLCAENPGWSSGHTGNFQNLATRVKTVRKAIDAAMNQTCPVCDGGPGNNCACSCQHGVTRKEVFDDFKALKDAASPHHKL